ncbi:MAG: dipeptide ABC transporter ATP-binding protein [Myxococcota bacterium]
MTEAPLIQVEGLKTYFRTEEGVVKAVDDISFEIPKGQTLGLVGESGSGKSVTSLTIMQLLPDRVASIEAGSISFLGKDLVKLPPKELREIRGAEVSMIFQEPGTSLNPVYRVGDQVMEAIRLHQGVSADEARKRTIELFDEVGIPDPSRRIESYPHQMSGGQKQRVMIAMAISCNPKLLIADEPTTALDVTIQAQILDLIRKLRDERQMSILFITHDLGVIGEIADDVAVMFRGRLVERAPVVDIFENPRHPYTRGLLSCRPKPDSTFRRLPTVQDYMEVSTNGDKVEVIERTDLSHIDELVKKGRGRLLHPENELKEAGFTLAESKRADDTIAVPEGQEPLLEVRGLKVYFPIKKGLLSRTVGHVKAVDGIDFRVYEGQTLGLVGESGCGKTTTGRAILQLQKKTEGEIFFQGTDVHSVKGADLRKLRRRLQVVFQDPYGSLNPRMTVEAAVVEAMKIHDIGDGKSERRDRAAKLLEEVGLSAQALTRYPHEFSGGQRQRIGIARALAVEPDFIVCDESVSALDVSVQAQVLNLLKDLQEERGLTYIFISHDLSVVKFMSDMLAVMKDGKIVEFGPSEVVYDNPKDPYTRRLIESIPDDSLENIRRRQREREAAATE